MKTISSNIIVTTDKRILIIVSFILFSLLVLLGCLIFFHATNSFLKLVSCIIWLLAILPFCSWKRCYKRKVILFPDHIIVCDGEKKTCFDNSEMQVITIGIHTIIYFTSGRRFVIMYTAITRKAISGLNNPLIYWGYNGDYRMKTVGKIVVASYIFLFLFHYATGTWLSNFFIWYLFITLSLRFFYWLINYLFFD